VTPETAGNPDTDGVIEPLTVKLLPNVTDLVDNDKVMAVGVDGGASANVDATAIASHKTIAVKADILMFIGIFIFLSSHFCTRKHLRVFLYKTFAKFSLVKNLR
jgi:hypothetical protein